MKLSTSPTPRFTFDSPPKKKSKRPLFARRHHFVIARLFSQAKEGRAKDGPARIALTLLQSSFSDTFKMDNPSFNSGLFNEMCIPEDERRKR